MSDGCKKYLDAGEYLRDIWLLASKVVKSDWRPDIIVALWRGGAPAGVAVHEFFKAAGWDAGHIPLKCSSYSGIGENEGKVEFTAGEIVFGMLSPGMKVLVVDDVFDTGLTAKAVKEHVSETGAEMRIAAVYWKREKNLTDILPDYYARETGTDWLVFPHEIEGLTMEETRCKDPVLADMLMEIVNAD